MMMDICYFSSIAVSLNLQQNRQIQNPIFFLKFRRIQIQILFNRLFAIKIGCELKIHRLTRDASIIF